MTSDFQNKTISVIAPAKINLSLHVIGKREDGYHLLQSVIAFADFGDDITISPAQDFIFTQESETNTLPDLKDNIIVRAAEKLAAHLDKKLHCHIHLNKKIPIGAGLGGGSSDAAAVIRGLLEFWELFIPTESIQNLLLSLGADVPVCYHDLPCLVEGIGEKIKPVSDFSPLPTILVFPNKFCSTKNVFDNYDGKFSEIISIPENHFFEFIKTQRNDLTDAAIQNIPDIENVLDTLNQTPSCQLARMSGSGSACFGLFKTAQESKIAAEKIQKERPNWWVRPILIQ